MDRIRRVVPSNKGGLPRQHLLIYLARPNSDEYLIGEDTEVGEGTYIWGYVLPEAFAATLGNGLFYSAGVPLVVLASEILAYAGTNTNHVLFKSTSVAQETGRLAVYDPATPASVLAKAKKVLRIT